jgi:LPXTG-motif cell wall-anchored protein
MSVASIARVPTLRRRLVTLLALVSLAAVLPAAAVHAQGAGDDQYQDPFSPSGSQGTTTKPRTTPTPAATPAPAPAPAATAPATASATSTPAAPAAAPVSSSELPRTGFDARPAVAAGLLLLLVGLVLRRRTDPR